jgi:hypothetical protein
MLHAVEAHRESVAAVLCGHLHLTAAVARGGVHHVCVGGTTGVPACFAEYDVYEDRIEACLHSAPHELDEPANNIHGRPRHDRDFTDAGHPTPEQYIGGSPGERRFTIPLPRALRAGAHREA